MSEFYRDAAESLASRVEELESVVRELIGDGCATPDGECFFCGGELQLVGCPEHPDSGCMGYSNEGEHEDDCPFIAARDAV